jgi:hypothetical protein
VAVDDRLPAGRAGIVAREPRKNGDGQIEDSERGAMLHVRAEQMIERHDTDTDGSLSRAELDAIQSGGRRRFMGNLAADANGDGTVSADELAARLAERAQQRRSGAGSGAAGAGQEPGAGQREEGGQGE